MAEVWFLVKLSAILLLGVVIGCVLGKLVSPLIGLVGCVGFIALAVRRLIKNVRVFPY